MTDVVSGRHLTAVTVPLVGEIDLVAVAGDDGVLFEHRGVGFAGQGVALRLPVTLGPGPDVADAVRVALGQIHAVGPGGPVALGALPFARLSAGELVVPRVLVRRDEAGVASLTLTGNSVSLRDACQAAERLAAVIAATADSPEGYRLAASMKHARWRELVHEATLAIGAGRLDKVVLARRVDVTTDLPLSPAQIVRRLRVAYPNATIFAIDGFVGASPELLVERSGDQVRAHPLAGTTPLGPGVPDEIAAQHLLTSTKDRDEHRWVVDAVAAGLRPWCDVLDVPAVPSLVTAGQVAHLGSLIEGRLDARRLSALGLVAALHPTPATAGTPTDAALDFIAAGEGFDRGRYAGPVGWVDSSGDGRWVVGIRAAQLHGRHASLYAGAGIVAGSDPASELAETQFKLETLLSAVVRP